jgi:hypothetical protein
MKQPISLHFTTKKISLAEVKVLMSKAQDLFPGKTIHIHHCFLDRKLVEEKGWSTELVEFFEKLSKKYEVTCWMKDCQLSDIANQREEMMKYIFNSECGVGSKVKLS